MTTKTTAIVGIVALLLLVLGLALPDLLQRVLVSQLETALNGEATIKDVEIQWLRGSVSINGIEASDTARLDLRSGDLSVDIALRDLIFGDLRASIKLLDAEIIYGDLLLKLGSFTFDGSLGTVDSGEGSQWVVDGNLSTESLGMFDRARQMTLLTLGTLQLENLSFNAATTAVHLGLLRVTQIGAVKTEADESRWLYGEVLEIDSLHFADNLLQIDRIDGRQLRSVLALTAEGELRSQGVLSASLDALSAEFSDPAASTDDAAESSFNYVINHIEARDSEVAFRDNRNTESPELTLQVQRLTLTTLDSRNPDAASGIELEASLEQAPIQVSGGFTPLSSALAADFDGEIAKLPLTILSPWLNLLAGANVTAGSLDTSFKIQIDSSGLSVALPAFSLASLDASADLGSMQASLDGANLQLQNLGYTDAGLSIEKVTAQVSALDITVNTATAVAANGDGAAPAVSEDDQPLQDGDTETAAEDRPASEDQPLAIRIDRFEMTDSTLQYIDRQFADPVSLVMQLESLLVTGLDNARPEEKARLSLKSAFGDYGRIDVEGEIAPFSAPMALDISGKIKALELPRVSPYIEPILGYQLTAGQFDQDFDIAIENNILEATNDINLRGLKVKKLKDVKPSAPIGIPLDTGLDMLRDRSGNITLNVPLEGHLDDPQVGLAQIISQALTKALTKGSTTFLKLALQPYGAIWMGAEMGLKAMNKVSLDPMVFPPLESELQASQLDYAGKLATILRERPAMSLTLCGIAGLDDHNALAENPPPAGPVDLAKLAKARSSALKSYLANTEEVDSSRLFNCKEAVEPEGKISGIRLEIE